MAGGTDQDPRISDAEELAILYESAPIGLAVVDREGRYLRVNARLAEINGISAARHIGRRFDEVAPDVAARIGDLEARVAAGQFLRGIVFQAETPAHPGLQRTFRVNLAPLSKNSQVVGASIAVEELTSALDAEAENARLSALLRTIGETSPDLIYAKDREGRLIYANPATCAVLGLPAEKVIGRDQREVTEDLQEADAIRATDERIMSSGMEEIAEEPFTSPDGTFRVFRSAKAPMRDATGTVIGLTGISTDITEIRRSEQALRESEARLRMSLDAARMTAWELDLRTKAFTLSRAIGGTEAEHELSPGGIAAFVHPEDRARIWRAIERAAAGEQYDGEYRLLLPGGRLMWIADRAELRPDPQGGPGKLVGIAIDITARKEAEAAAAAAAADLELVADNVSQHVWTADAHGRFAWFNRRWYDFTGTTPEEMEGGSWEMVHHPDHLERVRASWFAHVASGEPWEETYPLRGHDGSYRWFLTRAEPVRDDAGAIARWFGTNTDVTDQLETADALRRSEALFRVVSEAVPGMVFVAMRDEGNIFVNQVFREFTGLPMEQLLGQGWASAVHPDDHPIAYERWEAATRTNSLYAAELRFRRSDGGYRWHATRALPVKADPPERRRWVGVCLDIHDRRLAEEELQARIDAVVAEREAALFQLHEAQKLETIGQLTGGVAHDFNNLLTPIVGSLDLLRRRATDERAQKLIEGALTSAERARILIQRLLAFARRQTLQPRAVDCREVVNGMRELIERSLGPRIVFTTEIAEGVLAALVDPNQLELALLNLSVNARDAMPGGGTLCWSVTGVTMDAGEVELRPGRYVRIAVKDSGTGMSSETLARAVEPFFSTKQAGQGTGLGLSMVHGLAAQSGGAFRLDSAPGEGTTASLWLPVGTLEEPVPPKRDADVRRAARRAVVLLTDDEAHVRYTTAESLKELGYEVVAAASGQEALDLVADGLTPDLLVTDHLMPNMTGAQLATELRQELPDLPVLMITGYAQLRPEEAGNLEVLIKPYRHAELALRIADLLSEAPALKRA